MTSKFLIFAVLSASLASPLTAAADDSALFPVPAGLEPDVSFWLSIFTQYTTSEGVLHDNRRLDVVYEKVALPQGASRKTRQNVSEKRRKYYQDILRALAGGKRSQLTADEQRVLDLWPADVSNEVLSAAVGQIRFQLGLSDRFREGLERSGQYRAHIDAEFTRLGVPTVLAALPHVESSYNPDAQSHVGASGIWQFTRSTGRRFMQVDHVLDERNDPFLATTAAAKLLAYNYSIAGNWPMAITAYNHGLAGARRAMRQHGDNAYADILRNYNGRTFGFASRNFYVAFLAAKQIDQNPQQYFPGVKPQQAVDYAVAELPAYLPVDAVARALRVSERDLKPHNRAVQATIWQGSKYLPKNYLLRVPASMLDAPLEELLAGLPQDAVFAHQLPDMFHTIQRGDTLSEIADTYGTRVSTLVALNGLGSSHRIRAGQQLRLPAAGPAPASFPTAVAAVAPEPATTPEPAEIITADAPALVDTTAMAAADTEEESPGALGDQIGDFFGSLQAAILSDPSDYTVAENQTIEVHPLETLGHYADWLGIKTQRLRDMNSLAFRTPVEVGQRIKLDFAAVGADAFETARHEYHRKQQDTFFRSHTITGVTEHIVKSGESVWILSLRTYGVPVWLFRQYNPELDLHNVRPGTRLSFPTLVENTGS
jgi:membrane-bound lytic murein transglycosylase D